MPDKKQPTRTAFSSAKKRVRLNNGQKQQIARYAEANPHLNVGQLIAFSTREFG